MSGSVKIPMDDMFRVSKISLQNDQIEDIYVPGKEGSVAESPSSYIAKSKGNLHIPIEWVHPAWLYSGENYFDPFLKGVALFRNSLVSKGLRKPLQIENVKLTNQVSSINDLIPNRYADYDDGIPVTYTGTNLGPTDFPSIVSEWMSTPGAIGVDVDAATEFTFTIPETLSKKVQFLLPVSSPRAFGNTIWGEVGADSTLPTGAFAGLVKIKHEVKLSAQKGAWLLPPEHLLRQYLNSAAASTVLEAQQTALLSSTAGYPAAPSWYNNPMEWLEGTSAQTFLTALSNLHNASSAFYALGYEISTTTVGTGIFVKDQNKVYTLPWRSAVQGIGVKSTFTNSEANPITAVPMTSIMDCSSFLTSLFSQLSSQLPLMPQATVLPVAASDLFAKHTYNMFRAPTIADTSLYPYQLPQLGMSVTPLFIPASEDSHCFTPKATYSQAWASNLIRYNNLDTDLNLKVTVPAEWCSWYPYQNTSDLQQYILPANRMEIVYPDSPVNPVHCKNIFEMFYRKWETRSTASIGTPSTKYYYSQYFIEAGYKNSKVGLTIGEDSTPADPTLIPSLADVSMMLVGEFPAGTPAGEYKFKPFTSYSVMEGFLDAVDPIYLPSTATTTLINEATDVPYLGLNLITTQMDKFKWYPENSSDSAALPALTVTQALPKCEQATFDPPTSTTMQILLLLADKAVPLLGYPLAQKPMVIDVTPDGAMLCEGQDVMSTAPFYSEHYGTDIIVMASGVAQKLYVVEVEMEEDNPYIIKRYPRLIRTISIRETPYGLLRDLYGIGHTKDIAYDTGEETDAIALYCSTHNDFDAGTGLSVIILRDDFSFEGHKDTIIRIPIIGEQAHEHLMEEGKVWPKGIAIMYPYAYVLAYQYCKSPESPVLDPLLDAPGVGTLEGNGWQMCLYRIDLLAGLVSNPIQLKSEDYFPFNYGLPATYTTWKGIKAAETSQIAEFSKYRYTAEDVWEVPVSEELPTALLGELPTLAGIFSVSGQLLAVHNGTGVITVINPVTGYLELSGFSLFPFSTPFNRSVSVDDRNDTVYTTYVFQGKVFQSTHPFMHICIGDGLPSSPYSTSLDIQDVSFGTTLIRKAKVHNNLVRDEISSITLSVPDETDLPHSGMLWLSESATGDWKKELTLTATLSPNTATNFFIKVEPEEEVQEPVTLYLNAKFNRTTVMFGYKFDSDE